MRLSWLPDWMEPVLEELPKWALLGDVLREIETICREPMLSSRTSHPSSRAWRLRIPRISIGLSLPCLSSPPLPYLLTHNDSIVPRRKQFTLYTHLGGPNGRYVSLPRARGARTNARVHLPRLQQRRVSTTLRAASPSPTTRPSTHSSDGRSPRGPARRASLSPPLLPIARALRN